MEIEERGLYSAMDACRYLGGISRNTLYHLMRTGQIASIKKGSRRWFTKKHLDDYVQQIQLTQSA